MNETLTLARFARELRHEDVPSQVLARTKDYLLDQLGCQLCFAALPWSKQVYRFVQGRGGTPESTVVYYGTRLSADNAAFANGSFGHGYDYDDTNYKITTHPGCVIVPAALAIAERDAVDGKKLLTAIVVGYEVMTRVAAAVWPECLLRGHHTPPACGPFGAAAAVGRLRGFDEPTMVNALGIAGSHAAGLLEYTQTGGEVKRIHAGIPAAAGLRSALLAEEGLTGPPTVLEGQKGFCHVWVDHPRLELLTAGLGQDWLLMDTSIKPYSCCGLIHPILDVLDRLRADNGLRADDVASVHAGTSVQTRQHVGVIREPENVLAAQFSIPFSVAVNLLRGGNQLFDYRTEDLRDQRFLDVAQRVVVEVDDAMEREYRRGNTLATKLRVSLRDGRVFDEYCDVVRGNPERPLTHAEVDDKFRSLADGVIPAAQAERIVAAVRDLEGLRSATKLASLLVA